MDIFLDMTGTITDMESENLAMLKFAERIKNRFHISLSPEEVLRRIDEYRKPIMDRRDVEYTPIRFLILEAVKKLSPKPLCASDSFWVLDEYSRVHGEYVRLAPGAREALGELRSMAEHMGIITDGDRPYTDTLLKSLGIRELFDSVTTAEDAGVGKPNPEIFRKAMALGNSQMKIYIGDSEKRDMLGAKRAGMIAIKIGTHTENGDYVAKNIRDVVRIIQNLPR